MNIQIGIPRGDIIPEVFVRLVNCLRESGKVRPPKDSVRARRTPNEDNVIDILANIEVDPCVSIRKIPRNRDTSKSSVPWILKEQKFHVYQLELQQALTDEDYYKSLSYCIWLLDKVQQSTK